MYEFRYQRHSVKLLFGLSLLDWHRPAGQKLLPRTIMARWGFTRPLSILYLPRKHTVGTTSHGESR